MELREQRRRVRVSSNTALEEGDVVVNGDESPTVCRFLIQDARPVAVGCLCEHAEEFDGGVFVLHANTL